MEETVGYLESCVENKPDNIRFSTVEAAIGLSTRLAKAVQDIGGIEKRGHNSYFNYDFVTAEDIKWAARKALAAQEIAIIPSVIGSTRERKDQNAKDVLTTVTWEYTLICPEGYALVPWQSEAMDQQDKGMNKAGTAALKYFLIHLLQIPTGDEPDSDKSSSKGPPLAEMAAQMTTPKGTSLGSCTLDQLAQVRDAEDMPTKTREGAEVLFDVVAREVGPTDLEMTYDKLMEEAAATN